MNAFKANPEHHDRAVLRAFFSGLAVTLVMVGLGARSIPVRETNLDPAVANVVEPPQGPDANPAPAMIADVPVLPGAPDDPADNRPLDRLAILPEGRRGDPAGQLAAPEPEPVDLVPIVEERLECLHKIVVASAHGDPSIVAFHAGSIPITPTKVREWFRGLERVERARIDERLGEGGKLADPADVFVSPRDGRPFAFERRMSPPPPGSRKPVLLFVIREQGGAIVAGGRSRGQEREILCRVIGRGEAMNMRIIPPTR